MHDVDVYRNIHWESMETMYQMFGFPGIAMMLFGLLLWP